MRKVSPASIHGIQTSDNIAGLKANTIQPKDRIKNARTDSMCMAARNIPRRCSG